MRLLVLAILVSLNLVHCVSENIEAITSCWLLTLQDNQRSKTFDHVVDSVQKRYQNNDRDKIVHNVRIYMVKKCFSLIRTVDSKQILKDFEEGQTFHVTYREVVKGFDYTQYIRDLKNKEIIPNPQLDDTISSIINQLETEFIKEATQQTQEVSPPIGVFGFNLNYLLVFPLVGATMLAFFAVKAFKALQPAKKKR